MEGRKRGGRGNFLILITEVGEKLFHYVQQKLTELSFTGKHWLLHCKLNIWTIVTVLGRGTDLK